jgi:hypothetical protein
MVADNIFRKKMSSYKGTYGTSVVRSFKLYAACVGLNEKLLVAKNMPYSCIAILHENRARLFDTAIGKTLEELRGLERLLEDVTYAGTIICCTKTPTSPARALLSGTMLLVRVCSQVSSPRLWNS